MAKEYRHTRGKRLGNALLTRLVRRGKGPKAMQVVTVRARRTGKEYSTPVWIMDIPDGRYWVAVFGETNTIRNARAAGHVTVSRGDRREEVRLVEVPVAERVPLLRAYAGFNKSSMARAYFGATAQSSDAELEAIAPQRTVFKLERL